MRWELERDLRAFDASVRPLLEARIENNVPATVLAAVLRGQFGSARPVLAMGFDENGTVAAAALRAPPWLMLCTPIGPDDAGALLDLWLQHDPDLPGVNALRDTAGTVAAAWTRRTGGSDRPRTAMAMHSLSAVMDPPRPAPGRLVTATEADRDLSIAWWEGFVADSHVIDTGAEARAAMIEYRIAQGHMFLWQDDGRPVSMVAINPPTAGVVRIGPVYTPAQERGRGYASSAVAAVSRLGLDRGAHTCMLFTDVANPTSNKIYADVGYRRIAEWEERVFTPAPGRAIHAAA
jgi:predicted GNAT family acetyltransferase